MTNFFASNRERLISQLSGSLIVLAAHTTMQSRSDQAAQFAQEANFWWLSGIELPDWWLIVDGTRSKSWLVTPAGGCTSDVQDSAQRSSGVDGVLSEDAGMQLLRELAKKHSVVHTLSEQPFGGRLHFSLNPAPRKMYDKLTRTFNAVQDCRRELAQLRAIKQPEEIARIKKATNLTCAAFEQMLPKLQTMKYEYEIEAELAYYCHRHGADVQGYPSSTVAAGLNACNLHYTAQRAKLKKRELVLIDAGTRWQGYGTSITRTYSYGEPTKRQIAVYEAVREARTLCLRLLGPNLAVDQYQRAVDDIMQNALMKIGLLSNKNDTETYQRYFPHTISHGIGIDAHDDLGNPRAFEPGMVITLEPGIYIPEEAIGVRLGDTILITATGATNLSARLSTDL